MPQLKTLCVVCEVFRIGDSSAFQTEMKGAHGNPMVPFAGNWTISHFVEVLRRDMITRK